MPNDPAGNVYVIADPERAGEAASRDPTLTQRARWCFLHRELTDLRREETGDNPDRLISPERIHVFSVADAYGRGEVVDLAGASHVFISWDSANGDIAYGSDKTLDYFWSEGRVRLAEVLAGGAVVACEQQTVKGLPVQRSYDAIFGEGSVTVLDDVLVEAERRGTTVHMCAEQRAHPLLIGITQTQDAHYAAPPGRLFMARYEGHEEATRPLNERHNASLWFGWFTSWDKGWVPLFCAKAPGSVLAREGGLDEEAHGSRYATMLVKPQRNGLLIASTMWFSGGGFAQLLRNIVTIDVQAVARYHQRLEPRGRRQDVLIGVLVAAVMFGLTAATVAALRTVEGDATATALISLSGMGAVTSYVAVWRWFCAAVWQRPTGIPVRDATARYLKSR